MEEKPKIVPEFDKKYTTIIEHKFQSEQHFEIVEWINNNSNGLVSIKLAGSIFGDEPTMFIGFENRDDAIFFRIKFAT